MGATLKCPPGSSTSGSAPKISASSEAGPLLGEPSAHGSKSSIVRAMDETRPPARAPDPRVGGPLTRDEALAMLERAAELLASGDFQAAGEHYARVVGFDDPTITAAALLGLGEVRYRLDDEAAAVATWSAVMRLGETPSTYSAWRNLAAARVRAGDLPRRDRGLPRGGPARSARGQARDRQPARLADQGDRESGRGAALLRRGPGRQPAPDGDAGDHRG